MLGAPLSLLAAGCATQADVQKLERDVYRANRQITQTRSSLESIRRDLETLAGQVAQLRHARGQTPGGGTGGASYERLVRLEDRVAKLEMELERRGAAAVEAPGEPQPPGAEPRRREPDACAAYATDASAPEEMQQGGRAIGEGNYELAISEYRGLLRRQPSSPLADDAQFCIGEAYFQLGDYSTAIYEYDNVRVKYPSSDKIPMALLKSGQGFVKLGNTRDARLFFQKLVRDYGSSQEAIKARQELESLGAE